MDSLRTEYPNFLASMPPEQAITILQDRVSLIAKINNDIADWLQERRKVEEAYVTGLRKLAKRPQQDGGAALGVFQNSWQRIVSGTENLAASHEVLANKLETDVEAPLRSFATRNRDSQALSSTQGNLAMLAKDIANAQRKAAKGGRKADGANSAVQDTTRQWDSQAPYVFEQLQALDEARVNHLRDVLTQFQTHELDSIEKSRASAESILNALLSVETADEINTFVAKATAQRESLSRRRSSATASTRPASSHLRPPPTPPPPRHAQADDRRSQRSISTAGQDRLAPLPDVTPQKEKTSKLGGLKRLGTVMGRRKSTAPPAPHQSSNEEKRKTRSFAPFRRGDSSRSFHDLEASGPDLTPTPSQDYPVPSPERRHEPPARIQSEDSVPINLTNGTGPSQSTEASQGEGALTQHVPTEGQLPPPIQPTVQEPSAPATPAKDPITQAQRDAAAAALAGDESSRNFQIRDKPIQEDESEAQMALSSIANQLRTQAQSSGINRVQGSMRGRRDVRNTMFIPNDALDSIPAVPQSGPPLSIPATSTSHENILASPIQRPPVAPALHEDHGLGSDTTSVYSSRSLGGPTNHTDFHEPGLNVSILETVHSWFTESGVSKAFVLGEIAFAYNTTGAVDAEHETIRLQHFELLDKVAANPIYLTQIKGGGTALAEEQAGTYTIATSPIRRPSPLVGLKYQLHLEDAALAQYSPVLITPAWQIVEGQVSVIVLYSLNPIFGSEAITLKNVVISVGLDTSGEGTGKAISAMMSPTSGASFKRRTSAVVWKLNDFVVKADQERLLVRFVTQGGLGKKGTVELKFEIPGRTASAIDVEKLSTPSDKEREIDPFADDGGEGSSARGSADEKRWELLPARKRLVSGRYTAS